MSDLTIQDLQAGIDFTGLAVADGSSHNQLVELSFPIKDSEYAGKGLILWSKDYNNVPDVPDAVTNDKWRRYLWIRVIDSSNVKVYAWNNGAVSDATLLKWQDMTTDLEDLQADVDAATALATQAKAQSSNAISVANTANTLATQAKSTADSLVEDVDTAATKADTAATKADAANTQAVNAITQANAAVAVANSKKNLTDIINPGTAGQQARTKSDASAVEWFNPVDNIAIFLLVKGKGVDDTNAAAGNNVILLNNAFKNTGNIASINTGAPDGNITIAAIGTYRIKAWAILYAQAAALLQLYNSSGNAVIHNGNPVCCNTGTDAINMISQLEVIFTTTQVNQVLYLNRICSGAGIPLAKACNLGTAEIYAHIEIERLQ